LDLEIYNKAALKHLDMDLEVLNAKMLGVCLKALFKEGIKNVMIHFYYAA
jgi:hypothetical protein